MLTEIMCIKILLDETSKYVNCDRDDNWNFLLVRVLSVEF